MTQCLCLFFQYIVFQLKWIKWADTVQPYVAPMPFVFSKVLVPTVDTTRYTYLLNKMFAVRSPGIK